MIEVVLGVVLIAFGLLMVRPKRKDDETKAKDILADARSKSRGTLGKASPFTEKVVRDGTTLFRARFAGFDEADDAQAACKALKRSGMACFAARL